MTQSQAKTVYETPVAEIIAVDDPITTSVGGKFPTSWEIAPAEKEIEE